MFIELLEMTCRNFLSIGNKKEKFCFNKEAITVFKGDIGAGKSTIPDALSVLLFGKTYSGKNISSIVNWTNKRNCELSLLLKISGIKYEILRNFKPDSYALFVYDGNDERRIIELSNKDDLTVKIVELLHIDRKIFDQTVFLSQRDYEPFMRMSLSNKRDLIKRIFSLERYDVMKDGVNEDIKSLEKEVEQLRGKVSVYETQIETKTNDIAKRLSEHNTSIKSLENELSLLKEKDVNIPEFDNKQFEVLNSTFNSTSTQIELKKQEIKTEDEKWQVYNTSIKDIEKKKKEIQEKKKLIVDKVEVSKREELISDAIKLKADYDYAIANQKDYKKAKEGIFTYTVEQIPAIETEIKNFEKELEELNTDLNKKEKSNAGSESLKTLYKKSFDYYSSDKEICSECKKPITVEEKKEKTEEFSKLISELIFFDVKDVKDKIAVRQTSLSTLKGILKSLENYKNFKSEIIENVEIIKEKFTSTKTLLDKIVEQKKISDEINDLNKEIMLTSISAPESSISSLQKELETLETNFKSIKEKLETLTKEKEKIETLKKEKEQLLNDIKTKEKLISREKEIFGSLQISDSEELKNLGKNKKESDESINKKQSEISVLERVVLTLGDNGVKKYIIGRYLQVLNQIVSKYLSTFNCQFSCVFNNSKGLSCDIFKRGEEVPYENLSNGQSQQVNLAILFTFIEFLKIKNSSNFPLIFLDEMFDGSMSPDALREVVKGISSNIPYVNIITHREQNFEMADVLIDVKYDGRFSRYEEVYNTAFIDEKSPDEINIDSELF